MVRPDPTSATQEVDHKAVAPSSWSLFVVIQMRQKLFSHKRMWQILKDPLCTASYECVLVGNLPALVLMGGAHEFRARENDYDLPQVHLLILHGTRGVATYNNAWKLSHR